MLESIEGSENPAAQPPFAAEVGLFNRPTLINNVETLFGVRDVLENGPEWFSKHGRNGRKGLRTFSVSGRVREPGAKIAGAGITVRELIDEYCGGMADGHTFKGYLPGGASGGILPAEKSNIPLDFGTLEEYGCLAGSGAVIILSEQDSIANAALNLMRFYQHESCGQCTPCRAGCEKSVKLMEADHWDRPLLEELSKTMWMHRSASRSSSAERPVVGIPSFSRRRQIGGTENRWLLTDQQKKSVSRSTAKQSLLPRERPSGRLHSATELKSRIYAMHRRQDIALMVIAVLAWSR